MVQTFQEIIDELDNVANQVVQAHKLAAAVLGPDAREMVRQEEHLVEGYQELLRTAISKLPPTELDRIAAEVQREQASSSQ